MAASQSSKDSTNITSCIALYPFSNTLGVFFYKFAPTERNPFMNESRGPLSPLLAGSNYSSGALSAGGEQKIATVVWGGNFMPCETPLTFPPD